MVDLIITGAAGRMGKALLSLVIPADQFKLSGALEVAGHPDLGRDAGEVVGLGTCGITLGTGLEKAAGPGKILIDFTAAGATQDYLASALKYNMNLVVGTTGLEPTDRTALQKAGKKIAIVQSGNMSVGVNLLLNLVSRAAGTLGDAYDVEVVEVHHRFKKDAPSGTAKMLAVSAAAALGRDPAQVCTYGRQGMVGERKSQEIGIHAVRTGDVVGEHTVIFGGAGERIELAHHAQSRVIFAQGALRAAEFLTGKKNGLYDMQDVLGLK